jgi:hypothetical protein
LRELVRQFRLAWVAFAVTAQFNDFSVQPWSHDHRPRGIRLTALPCRLQRIENKGWQFIQEKAL